MMKIKPTGLSFFYSIIFIIITFSLFFTACNPPLTPAKAIKKACRDGDFSWVKELIEEDKVDVNIITDSQEWTPLLHAVDGGNIDIVNYLLEKGADINALTKDQWTPLMLALGYEKPKIAKRLIDKGADIELLNIEGWSALMIAVRYGQPENARLLIKKGADIHGKNDSGYSVLKLAMEYSTPDIAKRLLEKGADIHHPSNSGTTPLMAALQSDNIGNVRLALESGADVDDADKKGRSTMSYAAQYGTPDMINLLLEKGANIDGNHKKGKYRNRPPLLRAIKAGKLENARLMIDKGADVHVRFFGNALHVAARYGDPQLIDVLLKKGLDINATTPKKWTPLHLACRWSKSENATFLINQGADIHAKTRACWTPILLALENNLTAPAERMGQKGADLEKAKKEINENAALYYIRAMDNLKPAYRKTEKKIYRDMDKKSKSSKTIDKYLKRNKQVLVYLEKASKRKRCDFSFFAKGNGWDADDAIPVTTMFDDMYFLVLVRGNYFEKHDHPNNAGALYRDFLTMLRHFGAVDSMRVKRLILETADIFSHLLSRYFKHPKRDKALCADIHRQLKTYMENLFTGEDVIKARKQTFLAHIDYIGGNLERNLDKEPEPDADKHPMEAIKHFAPKAMATLFFKYLQMDAKELGDLYYAGYIKAAQTDNPDDWKHAKTQLEQLKKECLKNKDGSIKDWPEFEEIAAKATNGKPITKKNFAEVLKLLSRQGVKQILAYELDTLLPTALENYKKEHAQLSKLQAQALRSTQ